VSRCGNKVFRRIQKCFEPQPRSCHYSYTQVRVIHHTTLGCIATLACTHKRAQEREREREREKGRVRTCTGTQRLRTKPAANDSSNFRKLLWDARLWHPLQATRFAPRIYFTCAPNNSFDFSRSTKRLTDFARVIWIEFKSLQTINP